MKISSLVDGHFSIDHSPVAVMNKVQASCSSVSNSWNTPIIASAFTPCCNEVSYSLQGREPQLEVKATSAWSTLVFLPLCPSSICKTCSISQRSTGCLVGNKQSSQQHEVGRVVVRPASAWSFMAPGMGLLGVKDRSFTNISNSLLPHNFVLDAGLTSIIWSWPQSTGCLSILNNC